ncbi:MAG: hypothetical protein ACRELX_13135, partial [Longimicrobiales bacterium]
FDVFRRLRRAAGSFIAGRLLGCFYCLSLWLALPLAWWIGDGVLEPLLLWPALSGAAILLERATAAPPPATYFEDEETDHGMLRTASGQQPAAANDTDGTGTGSGSAGA